MYIRLRMSDHTKIQNMKMGKINKNKKKKKRGEEKNPSI
jgi:hypothetical protein